MRCDFGTKDKKDVSLEGQVHKKYTFKYLGSMLFRINAIDRRDFFERNTVEEAPIIEIY